MKVCMIVRNNFVHDSRVQREALSLLKRGYAVTVLAVKDQQTEEQQLWHGIRVKRIHTSLRKKVGAYPGASGRGPSTIQRQGSEYWKQKLKDFIKRHKVLFRISARLFNLLECLLYYSRTTKAALREAADVYHCHDLNTLFAGFVTSLLLGKPFIYDTHELWIERNTGYAGLRKSWDRLKWSAVERALIRKAYRVITVNQSIADYLADRYRIRTPETLMNCPPYQRAQGRDILRKTLGIPKGTRIVLYEGGITFNRGLEQLISSVPYLDNAVVVLMGYGTSDYIRSLKELTERHGVGSRVYFADAVPYEKLISYVSAADVGVEGGLNCSLSYYFGLGNKIFEYLMGGLPIAVSDFYPETRKILRQYQVGKTFDPEDPQDIARTINRILSDRGRYLTMRREALRAARERFNWEKEELKLLAIYEGLRKQSKCSEKR